jgi:hypothetical protein
MAAIEIFVSENYSIDSFRGLKKRKTPVGRLNTGFSGETGF